VAAFDAAHRHPGGNRLDHGLEQASLVAGRPVAVELYLLAVVGAYAGSGHLLFAAVDEHLSGLAARPAEVAGFVRPVFRAAELLDLGGHGLHQADQHDPAHAVVEKLGGLVIAGLCQRLQDAFFGCHLDGLKGNPSRGLRECGVLSIHLGILTVSGTLPESTTCKVEPSSSGIAPGLPGRRFLIHPVYLRHEDRGSRCVPSTAFRGAVDGAFLPPHC